MSVRADVSQSEPMVAPQSGAGVLLLLWLLATMSLWFFAFYSIPIDAPEWVRRAQIACFGSDESGLPGPAGWMVLVLSPGALLGAILIALGDEVRASLSGLYLHYSGRAFALIVCMAVTGEALWVIAGINLRLQWTESLQGSLTGATLPTDYPRGHERAPDFSLLDQHGNTQTLMASQGKPVLLSFVFAHCQAVCPTLVKTMTSATVGMLPGSYRIMLVTLDPWRDTPAALPGLAMKWELGADAVVLSGDPDEVNAVLDAYKVPRERDEKNGDVIHPALIHVIGPQGELAYSFNNPPSAWLKEAVARVAG